MNKNTKLTVVLDNVRSAWNVGSIFRTCDAIGADIILIGYTPTPTGKTLPLINKTAIGAENNINWKHFNHYQEVLSLYKDGLHLGIEISETSKNIFEYIKESPILENNIYLWFGNEIHGLEDTLQKQLSTTLHLPMEGKKESLNVSSCVCATGYLFKFGGFLPQYPQTHS